MMIIQYSTVLYPYIHPTSWSPQHVTATVSAVGAIAQQQKSQTWFTGMVRQKTRHLLSSIHSTHALCDS